MPRCPECDSNRLIRFGTKFVKDTQSKKRRVVQQYQCKDCGRITIRPKRDQSKARSEIVSNSNWDFNKKEREEGQHRQ